MNQEIKAIKLCLEQTAHQAWSWTGEARMAKVEVK